MANVRIQQLPEDLTPVDTDVVAVDSTLGGTTRRVPLPNLADSINPVASEPEATAGADLVKRMPSLRVKQSIVANAETGNFTQSGTGAVVRSLRDKNRDKIAVADFNMPLSGDISASINAAIDEAYTRGGGFVELPSGMRDATSVILKGGVSLVPSGRGSILQNVGDEVYFLRAEGSLGSSVALLSDAAKGDTGLEVASTDGLAAGDYIVVGNTATYAATDSNYKSGETVQIASVDSATELTLATKLYGSMEVGGAYEVADGGYIARISPIIRPGIEDVELVSDWASATQALQFSYALEAKLSPTIRDYGHVGMMLRGCIDTAVISASARNLRDDVPNGRAGYGVCVAGPSLNVRVQDSSFWKCRHGVTTIGGLTGYPHQLLISGNVGRETSLSPFDTHISGDGVDIIGNTSYRSGGSGITIRSKNTRVHGNTISEPAVHGISLGEEGLSGNIVSGNFLTDIPSHGISCSPSCPNLVIEGNILRGIGIDGIRVFGSGTVASPGLIIIRNTINDFALVTAGSSGIMTHGSVGSTGALIAWNSINVGSGSSAYAINTVSLTASAVIGNLAVGTYTTSMFNTGTNVALDNRPVDDAVPQIQLDPLASAIRSVGSATNIDVLFIPKGTGVMRYGTFTSNADAAITGYITIKDIGGTTRKLAIIA